MGGTQGNPSRRDPVVPTTTTPRVNGINPAKPQSTGRMTPIRGRTDPATFSPTTTNPPWGYETPANKILSNVPTTVTNRSSERRRRLKPAEDGSEKVEKPGFGSTFVESRFARVKTPTFESPRIRERSDSVNSSHSETPLQRGRIGGGGTMTPLQPTSKKDNFFHAKDSSKSHSRDNSDSFFFAANAVKKVPSSTSMTSARPRRLSNGSQYSSFSTAKEVTAHSRQDTDDSVSSGRQLRSPTKPAFFTSNSTSTPPFPLIGMATPPILGSPRRLSLTSQPSPLRMSFEDSTSTPSSPPEKESSPTPAQKPVFVSSPLPMSESTFDVSTDDQPKSLLPPTSDLENSARINRKVPIPCLPAPSHLPVLANL